MYAFERMYIRPNSLLARMGVILIYN